MAREDVESQNLVDAILLKGRALKKLGERHLDKSECE